MEEAGLVFRPFVNPWLLLSLVGLLAALSVAGYARTTRAVSPRFKLLLLGLRLGAVLSVMVCLLRPSLQTTHYELAKRPLLLLIDQSRSMSEIADTAGGVSRLEAVNGLLRKEEARLEALKELYDVVILGFGRGLLGRAGPQGETAARYSAYGLALEQAFTEVANSQSDAVVIFGDGSHNFGPPDPMDVAAALNEQGVPVYTVGVGQDQATSGLRDVKVMDVAAPKSVFLFTSFPVRPQVLFRGCQGFPVKVRLEFPGQPPQEQTVTVAHGEEVVPLEFEITPEKVGEYRLTVRAEQVPGEVLDTNNTYTSYVRVVSGGVRVGFFDTVRPESKFIARSLAGAEHLSVRRLLILSGGYLPGAQTEVERYDILMIGDLTSASLRPSRILELKRAVQEEGKGLVVLLTERSAGPAGWQHTALEDLLPVKLPAELRVVAGKREFRIAPEHADHPVLTLAPTAQETRTIWAGLPPLAGAVAGVELKRGATALARDQDGNPLLVVHRSGWGRVACLMADTTFRWFFTEQETQDYHSRFWRQLVMWTAGREEKPADPVRVELNKQRLLLEERLKISVHLVGAGGEPVRDAELSLRITDPRDETAEVPYRFSRQEGAYVAEYSPALRGDYAVAAEARRGEELMGRDRRHFHASSQDLELEDPIADLKLLRRISAVTQQAGGRYYYYTQAGELFEELKSKGKPLRLTTRRRRDIWDAWPLFAIFAACVVSEWALRKWKGLV